MLGCYNQNNIEGLFLNDPVQEHYEINPYNNLQQIQIVFLNRYHNFLRLC